MIEPELRTHTGASAAGEAEVVLRAEGVTQSFRGTTVLEDVSFRVRAGEIHALLGPNGAGKTTLVRILAGLIQAPSGTVQVAGYRPSENARAFRRHIGLVVSGDRTFYLRLSGLENLVFFGRLHGLRRRRAVERALELLADVGLEDAAHKRVGEYSHGMQKRLSVARALLTSPPVLLIDEATHDLDPEAARRVRGLVEREAAAGAAVAWVTQRLDEVRGFADVVTLLSAGRVRFTGSVPHLMSHAAPRRFVLHLRDGTGAEQVASAAGGTLTRTGEPDSEYYLLTIAENTVLGDVLAALIAAGMRVLSCQEERSEIEEAFVLLSGDEDR